MTAVPLEQRPMQAFAENIFLKHRKPKGTGPETFCKPRANEVLFCSVSLRRQMRQHSPGPEKSLNVVFKYIVLHSP